MLYRPTSGTASTLLPRTDNPGLSLREIIRLVHQADSSVTATPPSISRAISQTIALPRFIMTLLIAFAAIAVITAGVGLYGVVAYSVRQKTREIGIRIALGSSGPRVIAWIVRDSLPAVAVGVAVGIAAAIPMMHVVQRMCSTSRRLTDCRSCWER
ncbi:MAG TPA: FtsX-like permease family protein [Gemmatimonadaceae bacterium]|jgi:hypothetical protein